MLSSAIDEIGARFDLQSGHQETSKSARKGSVFVQFEIIMKKERRVMQNIKVVIKKQKQNNSDIS